MTALGFGTRSLVAKRALGRASAPSPLTRCYRVEHRRRFTRRVLARVTGVCAHDDALHPFAVHLLLAAPADDPGRLELIDDETGELVARRDLRRPPRRAAPARWLPAAVD